MKNRVMVIVLIFTILITTWCWNFGVAEPIMQYSGKYHDMENEYTTLCIEKNEDDYSVLLSIHRLIQLEFTAVEFEDKLKGKESFEDEAAIGVEMVWDEDILKATILESTWNLLPMGTEFHFLPEHID